MYGKVMSIPDSAMPIYFKLATRYLPDQVAEVEAALADGSRHPRRQRWNWRGDRRHLPAREDARAAEDTSVTVFPAARAARMTCPEHRLTETRSLTRAAERAGHGQQQQRGAG